MGTGNDKLHGAGSETRNTKEHRDDRALDCLVAKAGDFRGGRFLNSQNRNSLFFLNVYYVSFSGVLWNINKQGTKA